MAHSSHKYFSVEGGLSYQKLLKHFKDQAKGSRNISLLSDHGPIRDTKAGFRRPRLHGALVLVDMGDHVDTVNKRGEHVPKVEVVDPTEGDRLRAEAQVADENRRTAQPTPHPNNGGSYRKSQTNSGRRGGKTGKRRAATGTSAAKKAIKRAKDIFED